MAAVSRVKTYATAMLAPGPMTQPRVIPSRVEAWTEWRPRAIPAPVIAPTNSSSRNAGGSMADYASSALVHAPLRRTHTPLYFRAPCLLSEFVLARGEGRLPRLTLSAHW